MKDIENYENKLFEGIKHIGENGEEFWRARELMEILGYSYWQNFHKIIVKAMTACENSGYVIDGHFSDVTRMVKAGVSSKKIEDYELTRYACYLIAQNGDDKKIMMPFAREYFRKEL